MPYSETNFLIDHINITETINKLWWCVDRSDWTSLVDQVLAKELDVDYSAILGGTPKKTTGQAQVDEWRGLVETVDRCQHAATSIIISLPQPSTSPTHPTNPPTKVHATSNGIVSLVRASAAGGPISNGGGFYEYELTREGKGGEEGNPWRISGIKANGTWLTGNPSVLEGTVVKADA